MTTMTATHGTHHFPHRAMNPLHWVIEAFATHRQRLHLEDLDDHLLADIGLDREAARREAQRPFWDLR